MPTFTTVWQEKGYPACYKSSATLT